MKKNRVYYNVDPGDGVTSWYEAFVTKNKENNLQMEITYSQIDNQWTVGTRGETAMKIHDYGSGLRISLPHPTAPSHEQKFNTIDVGYDLMSLMGCFLDYYQTECDKVHGWQAGQNSQKIKKMRSVKVV